MRKLLSIGKNSLAHRRTLFAIDLSESQLEEFQNVVSTLKEKDLKPDGIYIPRPTTRPSKSPIDKSREKDEELVSFSFGKIEKNLVLFGSSSIRPFSLEALPIPHHDPNGTTRSGEVGLLTLGGTNYGSFITYGIDSKDFVENLKSSLLNLADDIEFQSERLLFWKKQYVEQEFFNKEQPDFYKHFIEKFPKPSYVSDRFTVNNYEFPLSTFGNTTLLTAGTGVDKSINYTIFSNQLREFVKKTNISFLNRSEAEDMLFEKYKKEWEAYQYQLIGVSK